MIGLSLHFRGLVGLSHESKSEKKQRRGCGNGCACAGTLFRPEELACCICFWNDEDGGEPVCLAESWDVDGVAATCRNKARACEISILSALRCCCDCCCCIFRSGDTGGNSQGRTGMDGRSQTSTRGKKCWQGLGSSLRKLFLFRRGLGALHSWRMLYVFPCGQDCSGHRWPCRCWERNVQPPRATLPPCGSRAHLYSRFVSKP